MASNFPKQGNIEPLRAAKRRPALGPVVDRFGQSQHAMVSRSQLLAAGLTRHQISTRIRQGLLTAEFRGVYRVGPMPATPLGMLKAATLSVEDAALSHRNALVGYRLIRPIEGPIHLTRPGGTVRPQPGLIVHRAKRLPEGWMAMKDGIPLVVPMLAIVQSAGRMGRVGLRGVLDQAEINGLLDIAKFDAILSACPNVKNRGLLLELIEPFRKELHEADAGLGTRFLRWCHERNLPMPGCNVPIGGYEVDFHWPGTRFIVETDGFQAHRTRTAFDRDRERWSALSTLGFTVNVVTEQKLRRGAGRLHEEILVALGRTGQHRAA